MSPAAELNRAAKIVRTGGGSQYHYAPLLSRNPTPAKKNTGKKRKKQTETGSEAGSDGSASDSDSTVPESESGENTINIQH